MPTFTAACIMTGSTAPTQVLTVSSATTHSDFPPLYADSCSASLLRAHSCHCHLGNIEACPPNPDRAAHHAGTALYPAAHACALRAARTALVPWRPQPRLRHTRREAPPPASSSPAPVSRLHLLEPPATFVPRYMHLPHVPCTALIVWTNPMHVLMRHFLPLMSLPQSAQPLPPLGHPPSAGAGLPVVREMPQAAPWPLLGALCTSEGAHTSSYLCRSCFHCTPTYAVSPNSALYRLASAHKPTSPPSLHPGPPRQCP